MGSRDYSSDDLKLLLNMHPVITKIYTIITPVVTAAYSVIRERVFMRKTGTFLYATPRMGKTTCAKLIKLLLEREFQSILVMNVIAEDGGKTEADLLFNILDTSKVHTLKRSKPRDLRRQLLSHVQSQLSMVGGNQFVLMIDEMQLLSDAQFDCLAAIHNKLDFINIRMTTVGFAQPEILDVRTALLASDKTYLIARFLCEPFAFNGCTSILDLKQILLDYDETQRFPEDSDYSYTRFFLPEAFENGFRLSDYSDEIWKALKTAAGSAEGSIPMEHLSRTVEYILVASSASDTASYKLDLDTIKAAVDASNLSYFNGLIDPKAYD
jgi:hypothetical protein